MSNSEEKAPRLSRRLQSWALQGVVLLILVLAFEAFLTRDALGVVAPAIESDTLGEERFSLQQLRGRPAVVHFWASWCPVCELEQGMVDALADEVPMITIAMQSGTMSEVRDYLARQEVDYPVVNDEQGTLSARYGVKAVPASFVLDSEGRVRFATRGYTTGWGLQIRLWLAGLF
jgi:thiol-disulfide isomerase/thioredoxin